MLLVINVMHNHLPHSVLFDIQHIFKRTLLMQGQWPYSSWYSPLCVNFKVSYITTFLWPSRVQVFNCIVLVFGWTCILARMQLSTLGCVQTVENAITFDVAIKSNQLATAVYSWNPIKAYMHADKVSIIIIKCLLWLPFLHQVLH